MTAPAELLFVSAGPQKVSPRVIHSFYWTQDVSKNWRECSFWHFALTLPSCFIHIPVGCKCNQASQWKHQNLDIFFFNHLFWKMTYEKQQLSRDTDMKRITITSTLQGLNYILKFSKCSFFFSHFFFGWNDLEKQNKTLVCFQRLFECCLTPSGYTAVQQAQWQPLQTQSDLDLKQYNLKSFFVRATNAVVIQHRAGTKMARLFKAHCV